ncbi:helix-turn-helix domain-containing protein [Acidisoma sp.]|uniref:helix-turn-helix domain-containing protein n=1 Tax=Acidisoma sp. TaxID=1872115 RepID=UPI0038D16E4D
MRRILSKLDSSSQVNQPTGTILASSSTTIPFSQRLTCTISEACDATGLGRTKLYELIGAGYIDTITVGRRRLVSVSSLRAHLEPKNA